MNPVTGKSFLALSLSRHFSRLLFSTETSVISIKYAELLFITVVSMKDACAKSINFLCTL